MSFPAVEVVNRVQPRQQLSDLCPHVGQNNWPLLCIRHRAHNLLEVEMANGRNYVIETGDQWINTSIQIEEKSVKFQQNGSFEIDWR